MSWRGKGQTKYYGMTGSEYELLLYRTAALQGLASREGQPPDDTDDVTIAIEYAKRMQAEARKADGDD